MSRLMIALSLVALLAAGTGVAKDIPWFDSDNCAMCKSLASNPELMKNLTWEQHDISNGVLAVTTVPEKYLAAYRKAHAEMGETVRRLQKGEMLKMCGSCTALGMCMMKGVKEEYVETSNGDVWIITSDKPEVVAELQSWSKRNKEEMAKIKSAKG